MKTLQVLTMILTGALLSATPLRAEETAKQPAKEPPKEPVKEMKGDHKKDDGAKKPGMEKMKQEMGDKMKGMEAKMKGMEAKEKAEAAEFDSLFETMNSSVGDKKTEAMAAILNKMAQKEKAMKAKCEAMMKGGMMKKDANSAAEPGKLDYYTCAMHPAVHWPIPAKCPICGMELVPVLGKAPGASPDAKPEAKPGEEPKKPADPHAAHH